MKQYKTIDVARRIGIHVNTVRLYEKCALIPKPERLPNGYRVFTDLHIGSNSDYPENTYRVRWRRTYRYLLHTKRSCRFSRRYHRHTAELGAEWPVHN